MYIIKSTFSRLIEALIWGAIFECLIAGIVYYLFGTALIDHLYYVYDDNLNYIANNIWLSHWVWPTIQHYLFDVPQQFLAGITVHTEVTFVLLDYMKCFLLAFMVTLQKIIIVLISLPIYAVILLVAWYDGWIARELRRYRVASESIRRKEYEKYAKRFERLLFIGYVSLPFYIPAVIWFFIGGILIAIFHRMRLEFGQKYL